MANGGASRLLVRNLSTVAHGGGRKMKHGQKHRAMSCGRKWSDGKGHRSRKKRCSLTATSRKRPVAPWRATLFEGVGAFSPPRRRVLLRPTDGGCRGCFPAKEGAFAPDSWGLQGVSPCEGGRFCARLMVCFVVCVLVGYRGGCGRHEPPHKLSGWGLYPAATYFTEARMRNPDTKCKRYGTDPGGVISLARRGRV